MKYRVRRRCFIESRTTGARVYERGEVIEYDGVAGESLEPIGSGPHLVEPRRFNIDGGEGLSLERRAEIYATRRPLSQK